MENNSPVILFRNDGKSQEELDAASKYFPIVNTRSQVIKNSLVIGRYSVLPYYYELCQDLAFNNSRLINSYEQHNWITSFDYYHDLKSYTPKTWDDTNFYSAPDGEFVVKGRTNSKKHKWNSLMFAENKVEAAKVANRLMEDMAIAEQGIVYRRYVPLKTYEVGLHGLPFTNEWRFFFYKNRKLGFSYYWTGCTEHRGNLNRDGINFVSEVASIVSAHCNFFVLDIAEKEDGGWILIEINDGQMSGLSDVQPNELYKNLRKVIEKGFKS